jgi:cysteine desulfurase
MAAKDSRAIRHYFDWAASAPFDYSIINQINDLRIYGNPSSQHAEGKAAKLALEEARTRCAAVLNVPPETLFFTSGGTESNSIALFSNLVKKGQGRIISSTAEHSSVREGMETLEIMGKPTGRIAVDSDGRVTSDIFAKTLAKYDGVRFASCMSVNNETGSITDIASLTDVIRKHSGAPVHLHCDLVQAVGKIPVDISGWEIDSASISAHKIGGPRGIGLLYLRKPMTGGEIFYSGGGQEKGVRGGTENTQGALCLASCLEKYAAAETVKTEYSCALSRWNKLITSLAAFERCTLIPRSRAAPEAQDGFSPYILQAAFKNIPGEVMARALDDMGFAVSTGSACSSSSPERPVLLAMGVEEKLRIEGIRISQGYSTTDEEIDLLIEAVAEVLKFL